MLLPGVLGHGDRAVYSRYLVTRRSRPSASLPTICRYLRNSRHRGVLGVEDGCTYSLNGHAASILENPLSASGVPTAIELVPNGSVEVRNIIGAVPVPLGWGRVKDIVTENGFLSITSATGTVLNLSFDTDFLKS